MQRLGAGAADIEHQGFGLEVAVRPQGDGARGKNLGLAGADVADRQVDLGARVSALVKGDLGGDAGIGQGAGSDHGIVQFHVMLRALASEAHGVNGNMAGAQRVDGIGADAAGVVVAVAEQDHGADGQVGSLLAQLLEAVADAGRGRVGLQILQVVDAGGHVVDAVETRLKRAVEAGQDAVLKRLDGLRLARETVLGYGHAARIVHQHGDDVLLRLQLGDGDGRLPQQHQQQAARSVCKPQMTQARQLRITGAACARRERISHARPTAAATISSTSTHFGHAPRGQIGRVHRPNADT